MPAFLMHNLAKLNLAPCGALVLLLAMLLGLGVRPTWAENHAPTQADQPHRENMERKRWRGDGRDDPARRLDEAFAVLEAVDPEAADRLRELREQDGTEFRRLLSREMPRLRGMVALKRRNPAMFELRVQEIRAVRSALQAAGQSLDAPEDEARREALRQEIVSLIDIRLKIRAQELAQLEARIAELREELDQHHVNREALIEERVETALIRAQEWRKRQAHPKHDADDHQASTPQPQSQD